MKKLAIIFIHVFMAQHAHAATVSAFAQLGRTAEALQAPAPEPARVSAPQCLSVDGRWGVCPFARRWTVPGSALAYLVDSSSRTYYGSSHPPRSVTYIAEYYAAEDVVSGAVSRYCAAQGPAASAECAFARTPGTRKIYDGRKVYLVNGIKVAEMADSGRAASAGQALDDNGLRIRGGGALAQTAVGCAMQDACWNSLNEAILAEGAWAAAEAARADAAAKAKDKG